MHHDSHILTANGYCETCGQPLPLPGESFAVWERKKTKSQRIGLGITIALHLGFVLYYLFAPSPPPPKTKSAPKGGEMVYISPLPITPQKPTPKPTTKPTPKKTEAKPTKPTKPAPPTKATPAPAKPTVSQPKLETFVPPVQATMTPPPEQDMSEMLSKRRAAREAANPAPAPSPAAESDAERAMRIAKANIAGANARGGPDANDTGGVFSVDKRSNSADVKFRGWNTNFKRKWLQQIHVEQGAEKDIETAVAKEMIKIIRKEKPGDFEWESRRLGRTVKMSARKEDEQELMAFLLKEMFPEYRP
ncbi:MAG: hypothetical protein ABW069_19200 [Duganella sp.]